MNIFSEVAIAGIGETKVGKIPGITGIQFQVEAARLALEDAGLSKDDVDGVFSFGGYSASMQMHALQVSEYMGMKPDFNAQVDKWTVDEVTVKVYKDSAIVWMTHRLVGPVQGKPVEIVTRYMDVFVLRDGRWLCVGSQSTRVTSK